MKYEPALVYEDGIASCVLNDGEKVFCGMATCHPDDRDMMNEKTGYEIAFRRAKIEYMRHYRDTLKIQLKALKQLYYSMNQSKRFNPKSYENKMLQRQIHMIELDLTTAKEMLTNEKQRLNEYISEKDKFYVAVRRRRKQAKNQ